MFYHPKNNRLLFIALGATGFLVLNIFIGLNLTGKPRLKIVESLPGQVEQKQQTRADASAGQALRRDRAVELTHLQLFGTLIGKTAIAYIYNTNTRNHGLYRSEDTIDGFRIAKIEPAKVVLEKDGTAHEIMLMSGSLGRGAGAGNLAIRVDDAGTMLVNKNEMMAQLLRANEILSKLKIMPLQDGASNKLAGFRLDNLPSGSILEQAGLHNGDVICSVQGQKLSSIQDALRMFNSIQSQSRIEVVLLRQDQPVTLRYEIKN